MPDPISSITAAVRLADRLAAHVARAGIRLYRLVLGPWLGPACRFEPSCSRYAEDAISRYGLLSGVVRAAGRLLRCQPFHPGGSDPVR